MEKIDLNFFGEKVSIDTPKDLQSLKTKISEKYCLNSSDTSEIILYYVNDSTKIYIINGNDYSKFLESKISTIYLDVNQNSRLYIENASKIKNQEKKEEIDIEKEKKEIEKMDIEKEEIRKKELEKMKLYNEKIDEIVKQILELEKLKSDLSIERDLDLRELSDKRNAIIQKIKEKKAKIEPKKESE